MRKFKPAEPLKIAQKLRKKVAQARSAHPLPGSQVSAPVQSGAAFEATMARAFPKHLRGTISGCCDSMADGHGTE